MSDDDLSTVLAEIRERQRLVTTPAVWADRAGKVLAADVQLVRDDVPRLLAALDAALKRHQPEQLHDRVDHPRTGECLCPHGPDYDGDDHYEGIDGEWYCVQRPTIIVCSTCADESDPGLRVVFPCPTREDILAALTGKEAEPCLTMQRSPA